MTITSSNSQCFFSGNSHLPKVPFLRKPAMSVYQMLLLMAEMLHQLIGSLSYYLQGFMHPRWCRISSVNSTVSTFRGQSFWSLPPTLAMNWKTPFWLVNLRSNKSLLLCFFCSMNPWGVCLKITI